MFRKTQILAFTAISVTAATLFLSLFRTSKKDEIAYQAIESMASGEKKNDHLALTNYCEQRRQKVAKELFLRDTAAKHVRIESGSSELFFFYEKKAVEVVEQLKNVTGAMQEEQYYLTKEGKEIVRSENGFRLRNGKGKQEFIVRSQDELIPMQEVRYFKAEKACYNYSSSLFVAEEVQLWKYRLKGHVLPKSFEGQIPLMSGTATTAQFVLKEGDFDFRAENLKVEINPKAGRL
jgi:hypothetical protein